MTQATYGVHVGKRTHEPGQGLRGSFGETGKPGGGLGVSWCLLRDAANPPLFPCVNIFCWLLLTRSTYFIAVMASIFC